MSSMRDNTLAIECKKHAYRQTQDGIVISFVCHPDDVPSALATAPLGQRYMMGLGELMDDETLKPQKSNHKLAIQASILCEEPTFRRFLWDGKLSSDMLPSVEDAEVFVREHCGVESRSLLDTNEEAAARWRALKADYEAWRAL